MNRYITLFLLLIALDYTCVAQTAVEVLVNNRGNNAIQKYDATGQYLGDFISPSSGGLNGPEDIIFHPDGTVLVTGHNNTSIKKYDGKTGSYISDFSKGYQLKKPSKMSIGPDSLIYVTQWDATQNKVVRFDLQGNYVDEFTSIGAPEGLGHVWDKNKNFYISIYGMGGNGTVHRFDSAGNDMGVFINSTILQGPTNIWWDTNGDLLVEDWTTGKVQRFDSSGQFKSTFVTGMTNPEGIAFLPDGNMLIGDWGKDAVHLVQPDGTLAGYFCVGNALADPNCVKVRLVPGVNVEEVEQIVFSVTPTIGQKFTIATNNKKNTRVVVLNSSGQVIEEIQPSATVVWYAQDYPDGLYYIVVSTAGQTKTEKVFVTNK